MTDKKLLTCCFTGHRKIPPEKQKDLSRRLKATLIELIENGCMYFGSGGAWGFDTLASLVVLDLKKHYPHIKLILVLPCLSQAKNWRNENKLLYEYIKKNADKIVYTSQAYTGDCMHKRNRHLVDNSSICICYLTESLGGTAYTVGYANEKGLRIINIAD